MELAARYGESWVTVGHPSGELERLPELVEQVDAACARAGRDPGSLGRLVLTGVWAPAGLESKGAFADVVGRYAEMGFTDVVVHWPRPSGPYAGDVETFERIFS